MKSLRAQLILRLLLGGVLLLGGAGAVVFWQMRRALVSEFDASLRTTAQSLATPTEQTGGRIVLDAADINMPQFDRRDGADVFLLRTVDGREIQRSPSLGAAALPLQAGSAEKPDYFDTTLPDGRTLRCVGMRFIPQEED